MATILFIAPTNLQLEPAKAKVAESAGSGAYLYRVVGTHAQLESLLSEQEMQAAEIHGLEGYPPSWARAIHARHGSGK